MGIRHHETAPIHANTIKQRTGCGSITTSLALPYLALPCLALPCLALHCLALPCLALPCLALPCRALPCLAVPCLALPCLALPCLGPLVPRRAVGARHDGLPRQFSPLLPVVCHGLSISEKFAGPLRDVVDPALFRPALLRLPSTVPCNITLIRPSDLVTCPYHFSFRLFTVARRSSYGPTRRAWIRLNRLRTGVGRFGANMLRWGLSTSDCCDCGAEQTADHISSGRCPIHRPPEGMHGLIELDFKKRTWLENRALDV